MKGTNFWFASALADIDGSNKIAKRITIAHGRQDRGCRQVRGHEDAKDAIEGLHCSRISGTLQASSDCPCTAMSLVKLGSTYAQVSLLQQRCCAVTVAVLLLANRHHTSFKALGCRRQA